MSKPPVVGSEMAETRTLTSLQVPHALMLLAENLRDATESRHVAFGKWISVDHLLVMHWPQDSSPCMLSLRDQQIPDPWRAVANSTGAVTVNDRHHWLSSGEDALESRVSRSVMAPVRHRQQAIGVLSLADRIRPYLAADLRILESSALLMAEHFAEIEAHRITRNQLLEHEQLVAQLREQLRMADDRGRNAVASIEELVERVHILRDAESQSRIYRAILNAIPDVVYLKGDSGYQFVNTRFESLFGVTNESVQGQTDSEVFAGHPQLSEQFQKNDEIVRQTGQPLRIEEVAPHADGPHRYATVKFPVVDDHGQVRAVAGISTDITASDEQKRLLTELMQAEQLQRHLYPVIAPTIEGFELFGATIAAGEMCGDYYDFIPLPDGSVVAALGDVCGHDLPAAMWMIATRSYLRGLLRHPASLGEIAESLDELVSQDLDASKFVSLFLVRLCPRTQQVAFTAAGHDGVILKADGKLEVLHSEDLLIGIESKHRNEGSAQLESGDLLLLWTDGLHEATDSLRNGFGRNALMENVLRNRDRPLPEIFQTAYQDVIRFHGSPRLADDATMVLIRAK